MVERWSCKPAVESSILSGGRLFHLVIFSLFSQHFMLTMTISWINLINICWLRIWRKQLYNSLLMTWGCAAFERTYVIVCTRILFTRYLCKVVQVSEINKRWHKRKRGNFEKFDHWKFPIFHLFLLFYMLTHGFGPLWYLNVWLSAGIVLQFFYRYRGKNLEFSIVISD